MAVNLLLSYAFHARTDLAAVRRDLVCGRLMVDSGAFTAFTKGRPIELGQYAEFLERWAGCWDHAITLDVIGDGRASARNTRKLHERGLAVMPVFTRGDTLAEFDAMVREVGYVCVGGLVGLPTRTQLDRVQMLQRRALAQGGGIHALGVGSLSTLRSARPYSADSSTVSGAFQFGKVPYFDGRRTVAVYPYRKGERAKMRAAAGYLRAHGIDLAGLVRRGRLPSAGAERYALAQGMALGFACADEWLKRSVPVDPPCGVPAQGPHYFNAVTSTDLAALAALDARVHGRGRDGDPPSLWRVHSRGHQCRASEGSPSPADADPVKIAAEPEVAPCP